MLEKAQGNIQTGLNHLDDVVGVRSRQIQSRLKTMESLVEAETKMILPNQADAEAGEEEAP